MFFVYFIWPRSTMDSIRVSEAPDTGSIPVEAIKSYFADSRMAFILSRILLTFLAQQNTCYGKPNKQTLYISDISLGIGIYCSFNNIEPDTQRCLVQQKLELDRHGTDHPGGYS